MKGRMVITQSHGAAFTVFMAAFLRSARAERLCSATNYSRFFSFAARAIGAAVFPTLAPTTVETVSARLLTC